jgi:hypothetical protein
MTLRYHLPAAIAVSLTLYDLLEREAADLVQGRELPGSHEVLFDAAQWARGLYFLQA